MVLPIVRIVLICKAMVFAHKATEFDLRCFANQNKPDNGQRHRVSHPVYRIIWSWSWDICVQCSLLILFGCLCFIWQDADEALKYMIKLQASHTHVRLQAWYTHVMILLKLVCQNKMLHMHDHMFYIHSSEFIKRCFSFVFMESLFGKFKQNGFDRNLALLHEILVCNIFSPAAR